MLLTGKEIFVEKLMTITDLAKGLKMDKANLAKLVKKLGIKAEKVRGLANQWTKAYNSKQIETVLTYRESIPHNLVCSKDGIYFVKD